MDLLPTVDPSLALLPSSPGSFCGRTLPNTTTPFFFAEDKDYIKFLDGHAKNCNDETLGEGEVENPDDACRQSVQKGACHLAFPKCDPAAKGQSVKGTPVAMCASFCTNERTACRTVGSAFGHRESIQKSCEGDPWVNAAGPSPLCTGDASALRGAGTALAAAAVAVAWLLRA